MKRLLKIATPALLIGALVLSTNDADAQRNNNRNNGKQNNKNVNKRYDRDDRYDRNDRYDRDNRYDRNNRNRNVRYGDVYRGQRSNLPPGQAKKVYGGQATDYAPGQVKKNNNNVRYDRRTRTVWDDIFGTRRR